MTSFLFVFYKKRIVNIRIKCFSSVYWKMNNARTVEPFSRISNIRFESNIAIYVRVYTQNIIVIIQYKLVCSDIKTRCCYSIYKKTITKSDIHIQIHRYCRPHSNDKTVTANRSTDRRLIRIYALTAQHNCRVESLV